MFNLIFNLYLKHKEENSNKMWERFMKLPKYIIGLFASVIICAVLSFILLFALKNPLLYWIPFIIELLSVIILGFSSEKYFINCSQTTFKEYANECQNMYYKVFKKCIISDEQLDQILNMANNKITDLQNKIDKKYESVRKTNQILFIPLVLSILKSLWDSPNDISTLTETSLAMIILYLIIYNFMFPIISLINYDTIRQINKLKYFADDLQGVIDIMVNFKLSENVKFALEEHKTNNKNDSNSNNKVNE